ncbi:tetratricopeptide repeat protein [Patescibacteria group bacterium]|nr:tetratricopeptide repeat protein [Patescibacteria group bacterium]
MIDIILIVLIVLSLAFIIWLMIRKIPRLKNVNVDNLPEVRSRKQKEAILKSRLEREWLDVWFRLKGLTTPAKGKVGDVFSQYYQRLKSVEKDIRRRGFERLTSSVDRSQVVDKILVEAKQFINSEEYQKAEETLLDVLNIDQHNIEAYTLLAEVYRARKEFVQAKETLEYLLKLTHNEDAAVYYSLGDLARKRGNLKQAEEEYKKSISLSEDNYLYFLALSEVYLDLEEEEKAMQSAQRALLLSPNNPKILDFLINLSIIMSDKELASGYLDKLKEVNPDNKKILDFNERIDNLK